MYKRHNPIRPAIELGKLKPLKIRSLSNQSFVFDLQVQGVVNMIKDNELFMYYSPHITVPNVKRRSPGLLDQRAFAKLPKTYSRVTNGVTESIAVTDGLNLFAIFIRATDAFPRFYYNIVECNLTRTKQVGIRFAMIRGQTVLIDDVGCSLTVRRWPLI